MSLFAKRNLCGFYVISIEAIVHTVTKRNCWLIYRP